MYIRTLFSIVDFLNSALLARLTRAAAHTENEWRAENGKDNLIMALLSRKPESIKGVHAGIVRGHLLVPVDESGAARPHYPLSLYFRSQTLTTNELFNRGIKLYCTYLLYQ